MPENTIQKAHEIGQSIWFDFISRDLIDSGELKRLVESGVRGVTSNPSIFQSAISGSTDYDNSLIRYSAQASDSASIFELVAIDDVRDAATPDGDPDLGPGPNGARRKHLVQLRRDRRAQVIDLRPRELLPSKKHLRKIERLGH